MPHGKNSIHRTAGYVTRSSGGVGGRGREASSYPDYEVGGTLTVKGVSRDITALLTLKTEGSDLVADGQFELKRLDFNVGDGPWADTDTVANEVQIKFKLRLKPGN